MDLPQIDDDQKAMLEEEFTLQEVKQLYGKQMRLVPLVYQARPLPSSSYCS